MLQRFSRRVVASSSQHGSSLRLRQNFSTTAGSSIDSTPLPLSHSSSPLRLGILGSGLTGLTLAHQLQRRLREAGRQHVDITIHERSGRIGGWMRTDPIQTRTSSSGYLLERGPRSFMFRANDEPCYASLELIRQLHLGDEVITADTAAAKRFVWNGGEGGHTMLLPGGLKSFWGSPLRNSLLRGLLHDYRTAAAPADGEDESVHAWFCRRFNSTVADELIDPMIAGIYAGDPKKLSVASCLSRLIAMEQRSGGVIRDVLFRPKETKAAVTAEKHQRFDHEITRLPDAEWMVEAKKKSIYSFKRGVATLTRGLEKRLQSDAGDAYAQYLPGSDARVSISRDIAVTGLLVDASNKPVIRTEKGQEHQYDHVFSTLPSVELHRLISSPSTSLPLASAPLSRLLQLVDPTSSMPFADVWVVNIVYDREVLQEAQRGFGLLVPTKHALPGSAVLGITFDSCVFPQQNATSASASASGKGETRFTVMLGGDRYKHLISSMSSSDIELQALTALSTMLSLDLRAVRPVLVSAMSNRTEQNC